MNLLLLMLGNDLGCEVGGNGGGEFLERWGEVGEVDLIWEIFLWFINVKLKFVLKGIELVWIW